MAIAFVSAAAASTGTTSVSPAYPSTPAVGNLILCFIASKEPASDPTHSSGFTLLAKHDGVSGGAVAANAGPTSVYIFVKESDGTESGTVTFTISGGDASVGRMALYSKATGNAWNYANYTSGEDSTSGTSVSVAGSAGIDLAAGDFILGAFSGTRGNTTASAQSFSATGATFSGASERIDSSNSSSPGCMLLVSDAVVTVGSNNTPTAAWTTAASTQGPAVILRLRETPAWTVAAFENVRNASAVTSIVVNKPSGTASGDLLILFGNCDSARSISCSGFTALTNVSDNTGFRKSYALYKVAGGSEPASYTVNVSGASALSAAILLVVGATDPASNAIEFATGTATPTGTAVSPSVTPSDNDSLILRYVSQGRGGSFSVRPSTVLFNDAAGTPNTAVSYENGDAIASGTANFTYTPTWHEWSAITLAIAPSSVSALTPRMPLMGVGF